MKRLQNRLMVNFTLISIIPVILIGLLSYLLAVNLIEKKVNNAFVSSLTHVAKNVENKIEKFERFIELLRSNKTIQKSLRSEGINEKPIDSYNYSKTINELFTSFFYQDASIDHGIIISKNDIINYKYRAAAHDMGMIKSQSWYDEIKKGNANEIVFRGIKRYYTNYLEYDESEGKGILYVMGGVVRDTSYLKNLDYLGTAMIFVRADVFSDILLNVDLFQDTDTIIIDENGNVILNSSGYDFSVDNILKPLKAAGESIKGSYKVESNQAKWMVTHLKLNKNNWRVLHVIPYNYYISEAKYIGFITAAVALICLLLLNVISYLLSKSISAPVMKLADMMKIVGSNNFEVNAVIDRKDEIGIIYRCFNRMVGDIKALFKAVEEKERKKRKAEIKQLQYQINPHFLQFPL